MSGPPPDRDSTQDRKFTTGEEREEFTSRPDGATLPLGIAGPDSLPEHFGRYHIRRLLGKGGMGTVYLAQDTVLDRPVALKVPHRDLTNDPLVLERFYREARAAAGLHHPNICPVYDVGVLQDRHYLTMAYIEGQPLADRIPSYRSSPGRIAQLVRALALGLEEAHQRGVVHRDLKPSNIMIKPDGEPVVMDFGLARQIQAQTTGTTPGLILGTPEYMAPEQASGNVARVGPHSDIYSLGVILYELLTSEVPFQGTTTEILAQILRDPPLRPSLRFGAVDPTLETACMKALAKLPEQRQSSMAEFAQSLRGITEPGGQPTEMLASSVDGSIAPAVLQELIGFLQAWGWEKGLQKARKMLMSSLDTSSENTFTRVLNWLAGKEALPTEVQESLRTLGHLEELSAWAHVGQAFDALHSFSLSRAGKLILQAPQENVLQTDELAAHLSYLEGILLFRRGLWDLAVRPLQRALELLGRYHFMTGRVLDMLGRVYAGRCNFLAAREFHQQAIHCKAGFEDDAEVAFSYAELGRLYLDWGLLEQAEENLNTGLRIVQRAHDEGSQAEVFHLLGLLALAQAERDVSQGKRNAAQRQARQAAELLDWGIRYNEMHQRTVFQARGYKDQARVCLLEGNHDGAENNLQRAQELFHQGEFVPGLAEVQCVRGSLHRAQGRYDEALQDLRQALVYYDNAHMKTEAARAQHELARTLQASRALPRMVTQAYLEALRRAEDSRHTVLVRAIEEELRGLDEQAHGEHIFRRVRGRAHPPDTTVLDAGWSEPSSVLFFNLVEFIPFCQGMDPGEVMLTLNQMLADLSVVLERYRAQVTTHLGGGFMALVREVGHAERAVCAALDLLDVVAEFNHPREVLGLRQLPARVAVATGNVFLGNIGTYHKMEFTAISQVVNLASRLMRMGDISSVCISRETYEHVYDRFVFKPNNPRSVNLPLIGRREVWDVIRRKKHAITDNPSRGGSLS